MAVYHGTRKMHTCSSKMVAIAAVVLAALTLLILAAGPALDHDAEGGHFSLEASGASGSVCMLSPLSIRCCALFPRGS